MSLPTHLRDIDVSKCFCSLTKDKKTQKDVIKLHAMPGRRTNISCQLGDDDMVDASGNPAPLVPLKGPSSFEDTQPDKPSIFTRCADEGTSRVLQALDELLPNEMERLGLKDYKRQNYRPLYHAPDPESDGGSGAISIKFDKIKLGDTKNGVVIMELEDPDDDESEIRRDGELDEIQPGVTESMYMRVSISSIWKGRGKNPEWGATIWCNKIAARMGTQDDGLVIGSQVLRGDQLKDLKPSKRGRASRPSSDAPAKRAKRVVKEESESESDHEDDVSTAAVASRSERVQEDDGSGEDDEASDHEDEDNVEGSAHEDEDNEEGSGGEDEDNEVDEPSDAEADEDEESEEEEERVPTPPPAPKPKKKSSKTSKSSRSSRASRQ